MGSVSVKEKLRKAIYRLENAEKIKLKNKEYNDKTKDLRKLYYQNNRERLLENKKRYNIENFERLKEYKRQYREKNREKILEKGKLYRKTHKEVDAKYQKKRLKNDPFFRMVRNLRRRLHHALKSQVAKKSIRTLDEIGCTPEFLRNHLESQFKEGMAWDNHGIRGWHVDHIKPCSAFDLNNPEEQKMVNHYTNLQPLWWYENLAKGDKF